MKQHLFSFSIIVLAFINCKPKEVKITKKLDTKTHNQALRVLAKNCISCHAPDSKIAPNLLAIKTSYGKVSSNETEFANKMTDFLLNPTIDNSKMPKAIEKFGMMPNLGMDKEQYNAVATYLFNIDISNPDWYKNFTTEFENLPKESTTHYLKKGKEIALGTKAVLGKNLLTAIKTKGTDKALAFCNEKAIHLTDSMSIELNTKVKRVSDKNRNPNNMANANELAYINEAKSALKTNGKAKPKIQDVGDKVIGYYPITTNKMCMQCHGNPKSDIDIKTFEMIEKRYPDDKAIGYTTNELRGIWVIEMEK